MKNIRFIVFLSSVLFVGCGYAQVQSSRLDRNGQVDQIPLNQTDKPLFRGMNLVILSTRTNNLEPLDLSKGENDFCFKEIDLAISTKHADLFPNQIATKYYHLPMSQTVEDDRIIYTVKQVDSVFSALDLASFKELDHSLGMTDENEIYVIQNASSKYLVLIGRDKAATGIGTNYWSYFLLSLNTKQEPVEFSSLSKNPFSVKLNESNNLYYVQLDDNNPSSMLKSGDASMFKIKVSVIKYASEPIIKLVFNHNCKAI